MSEVVDKLKNGFKIYQEEKSFRFGIDAVLLADYACKNISPKKKHNIIDLCSGNGIIPLLMIPHFIQTSFTGLEIQEKSFLLAKKSITVNNLQDKFSMINGDLKNIDKFFNKHSFSIVTCNPPYMPFNHGKTSPYDEKAIARHEILCNIEDIISSIDFLLQTHGKFFIIHKPERLQDIFSAMTKHNLFAKRIRFIHPFQNFPPNLVLIEGRKNSKSGMIIDSPLIVRKENNEFTEEIQSIHEQKNSI